MTPTLEARLAELLPCSRARHTPSCGTEGFGRCPYCSVRPAILTLIRKLLHEERERCAETARTSEQLTRIGIYHAIRNLGDRE